MAPHAPDVLFHFFNSTLSTDMFLQALMAHQKPAAGRHPTCPSRQTAAHNVQPASASSSLRRPTSYMCIRQNASFRLPTPISPRLSTLDQYATSQPAPYDQQRTCRPYRAPAGRLQFSSTATAGSLQAPPINQRPFSSSPSPSKLAYTGLTPPANQLQPACSS
jgi:hypothetical protein